MASPLLNLIFFIWLPIISSYTYEACDDCTDRASTSQLSNMAFRLYSDSENYRSALVGSASDLIDYIDATKPTLFYIPGWTETFDSISVQTILTAYFERDDHNVLYLDWEVIASGSYIPVILSVESVGWTVGSALNVMAANGFDTSKLHIVSHSMGSQVAAYVGLSTDTLLPRITGLDPAGPSFYLINYHLNASCAEFVDVIHTDAGIYGTGWADATVDIFPNFGTRIQPGCPWSLPFGDNDFCSHHRSWHFYTESLRNVTSFPAIKCSSHVQWVMNNCDNDDIEYMGYGMSNDAKGFYFLQTNEASPYGKGTDGISFSLGLFNKNMHIE